MEAPEKRMNNGRDPRGRFQKGNAGNPGGRPKGLAALIREETSDGKELVDFALAVFRGKVKGATLRYRIEAGEWLADRGFGKPVQAVESTQHVDIAERTKPLRGFTIEELRRLLELTERSSELHLPG